MHSLLKRKRLERFIRTIEIIAYLSQIAWKCVLTAAVMFGVFGLGEFLCRIAGVG